MRNLLAIRKTSAAMAVRCVAPGSFTRALERVALAASVLGAVASCGHAEATRPPSETSASMNVAAIPPSPVSGTIDGQRFAMQEAWYRVVRKAGRERIDIIISEGHHARLCAESIPEMARHVWVRFPHWQHFAPGEYRVDPGTDAPLSVHYEVPAEHVWAGRGVASAVVSIESSTSDSVTGRIRACFGDATQSCVTGAFHAVECRNELEPDGPNSGNIRRRATQDAGAEP